MTHALIIDDNMIISRAIENRLTSLGFDLFDRTWTEAQAIEAARCRPPDLVVIGDSIACGSPVDAARHIAAQFGTPILIVASGCCEVRRRLPEGAMVDGPFLLSDLGTAVAAARRPQPMRAEHRSPACREAGSREITTVQAA
jgi:DNA-binding response OmpR family regulator